MSQFVRECSYCWKEDKHWWKIQNYISSNRKKEQKPDKASRKCKYSPSLSFLYAKYSLALYPRSFQCLVVLKKFWILCKKKLWMQPYWEKGQNLLWTNKKYILGRFSVSWWEPHRKCDLEVAKVSRQPQPSPITHKT